MDLNIEMCQFPTMVEKQESHLSGRLQIKKDKDDFNIRVTVDDDNRKLFQQFEDHLTALADASLKMIKENSKSVY